MGKTCTELFEGMDCTFKVTSGSTAEEYVKAFGLTYKK